MHSLKVGLSIDDCQCLVSPEDIVPDHLPALSLLPVLSQPDVEPCCSPVRSAALAASEAVELARRFAALADPVRLQLLSLLATDPRGAVCACDLVEPVGKSQPTVSHHLKLLREAGLVTSEKRGVNVWYAVVPKALDLLRDALGPAPALTDSPRSGDDLRHLAAPPRSSGRDEA
jgi:ArsR family transcriptional regulator, arsenate/arsenite/antimonite-responsive transcriptional repressor